MKIYDFSNGDELHHYKKALVLTFRGSRDVLSTGPDNVEVFEKIWRQCLM